MTKTSISNWKNRYNGEVQVKTAYYENLNEENAKNTVIRKITEEEKKIYETVILNKTKQYFNPLERR